MTTADGRKIKVQSIAEYLAKPRGVEVNRVSLETTGDKIGRKTQYIALAPIIVLAFPLIVMLAIGMSGEGNCHGTPCLEESVLAGTHFYFAVSKDVRFLRRSASPRGCDTPETVTDSPIHRRIVTRMRS